MNWYPILEEYTEQLPDGTYVNKKEPSYDTLDELSEHSGTWLCCAVGSGMQKIVPSWNKDEDDYALESALCLLDKTNNTSLKEDGMCFNTAIKNGDMADARRLFDEIDEQIEVLTQEDIYLVDTAIQDYEDDTDDDDDDDEDYDNDYEPCDCEECAAK